MDLWVYAQRSTVQIHDKFMYYPHFELSSLGHDDVP